jgi:hypothetical protein
MCIGVLSGSIERGTLARFTTQVNDQHNTFSAGNVLITSVASCATCAPTSTLTMTDLAAGDNFDAQLDIANAGTIKLGYTLANPVISAVTGSVLLASTIQLTVRVKTANPCANRDGVSLYSGELDLAATASRTLLVSTGESLCFTIVLPTTAGTALQNSSLAATFAFQAVQQ